jgi:GT2 family glycosyltransferase
MKVLIAGLTYGNRPHDILMMNILRCGYKNGDYIYINTEGIANAMNEAIDIAGVDGYDAIAYLANDIVEPNNWLAKKVEALQTYPSAGIVASSLDRVRLGVNSEHIISNWLLSIKVVEQIGIFNESMFPYGPIDLDYCERANLAGFNTYYVK